MKAAAAAIAGLLLAAGLTGCGGNGGETNELPDTTSSQEESTLRSAAEDILQTQQAPSGVRSLIDDAHSATEQANRHTEELEQMMGDM